MKKNYLLNNKILKLKTLIKMFYFGLNYYNNNNRDKKITSRIDYKYFLKVVFDILKDENLSQIGALKKIVSFFYREKWFFKKEDETKFINYLFGDKNER